MDLKEQYDRLLRFCYLKTGNREDAEDITQETFLRFWKSHTYRETGKELAYLYAIAKNIIASEYRKPHPELVSEIPELSAGGETSPDAGVDAMVLHGAMRQLPEDIQEILLYRYVDEYSVTEIGRIMKMSRFAVHRRLKQALLDLRQILGKESE